MNLVSDELGFGQRYHQVRLISASSIFQTPCGSPNVTYFCCHTLSICLDCAHAFGWVEEMH